MRRRTGDAIYITLYLTMLALALFGVIFALASEAGITGDSPPASGDWLVENPTTLTDETVVVTGDVVLNSTLTMVRSTLVMNVTFDDQFGIVVDAAGTLQATDSKVTSIDPGQEYSLVVLGRLNASRTVFEECHMGVRILSSESVLLEGCSILESTGCGLYLRDADGTVVRDLVIRSSDFGMTASASLVGDVNYLHQYVYLDGPSALHVDGGSPTIEGVTISVRGTSVVNVATLATVYRTYVHVEMQHDLVRLEGEESVDLEGLSLRDCQLDLEVVHSVHGTYSYGRAYIYNDLTPTLVGVHEYGDVRVAGLEASGVVFSEPSVRVVRSGTYSFSVYDYSSMDAPYLVRAEVDRTFSTPGPHDIKLAIEDLSVSFLHVIDAVLTPGFSGGPEPTFNVDLTLINVTVDGGRDPMSLLFEPTFTSTKTVYATVTLRDCVLRGIDGRAFQWEFLPGPGTSSNVHNFELHETMTVEGCTVEGCTPGTSGIFYHDDVTINEFNNEYDTLWNFRGNTFRENLGRLLYLGAHVFLTDGTERFLFEDNTVEDNSDTSSDYLLYVTHCERTTLDGNTFRGNVYAYGIYFDDRGGDGNGKDPSRIVVVNNTFDRCSSLSTSDHSVGVLRVDWGGDLEVAHNTITRVASVFLNLDEFTTYSGYSRLDFHDNQVSDCQGTVVYFYNYDYHHALLSVEVAWNTVKDCYGPLLDYYRSTTYLTDYDYDARASIHNNTVTGSAGSVINCYGDVEVRDNTFTGCQGPVVALEYLNLHPPTVTSNVVDGCGDVYLIAAKRKGVLRMTLSMEDLEVNCTGTAFHLVNVDASLERVEVSDSAEVAILADDSYVDAIDSYIPMGSAEVEGEGSVGVWFNLEVLVRWTNASMVDVGEPIPGALVVLHGTQGAYYRSLLTDGDGRVPPMRVLQWSMDGPFLQRWSPFRVSVARSGVSSSSQLVLDRSMVGEDALELLLADLHVPVVRFVSPGPHSVLASGSLTVSGFVVETGSGIDRVTISVGDLPEVTVELDGDGQFRATFDDVPEGEVEVVTRALDVAGNEGQGMLSVRVDMTPPVVQLTSPEDGLVTNAPSVLVVGMAERGSRVLVNNQPLVQLGGAFSVEVPLHLGLNLLVVEAIDAAGNSRTLELEVARDDRAPSLVLLAPVDGHATRIPGIMVVGETEPGAKATLTLLSGDEQVENVTLELDAIGGFSHASTLVEGRCTLIVRAVDAAGNVAEATRTVELDTTAPGCGIDSPATGLLTREGVVRVTGWADTGGATLFLDGKQILNTGSFERLVGLAEGENVISLRAVDPLGNVAEHRVVVTLDTLPPVLEMTSPLDDLVVTNAGSLVLSGRVLDDPSELLVQGSPVAIDADGSFTMELPLTLEGVFEVTLEARDEAGNSDRHVVTIDRWTQGPPIEVTYLPTAGDLASPDGTLYVQGTTSTSARQVTVVHTSPEGTVTLVCAVDWDGSFIMALDLVAGENLVQARVVDGHGNAAEAPVHKVTFQPGGGDDDPPVGRTIEPVLVGNLVMIVALTAFFTVVIVTRSVSGRRDRGDAHHRDQDRSR